MALDEGVSSAQGAPPPVWLETPALKGLWATLNAPASRLPLFEERDGKLYLADGGSLPHTYRGFFDVIADDSSFILYVKCRVGGCDSKAMIPVTHNGKVNNFSNAATHIKSHFKGIMTYEATQTMLAKQAAATGKGAGASASASESGDVGEGAAKRPRMSSTSVANDTLDGSVVVNGFTFTKEQLKKMWLVVMGMLPFNIVRNPGVVGFMSALGVPVAPYMYTRQCIARSRGTSSCARTR